MARYAESVILAWNIAANEVVFGNATEIEPAHLLLGLCKLCDIDLNQIFNAHPNFDPGVRFEIEKDVEYLRLMFQQARFDQTYFRRRLRTLIANPGPALNAGGLMHRSQESRKVFQRSEELAASDRVVEPILKPPHMLQAVFEIPNAPWSGLLEEMGILDPQVILVDTLGETGSSNEPSQENLKRGGVKEGQRQAQETPYLEYFGRNLNQLALENKLDPVIGRREEMRDLARVLTQKRKNNAILVGDAGVGKTCIVEGLAQRLESPKAPTVLKGKQLIEVSMSGLLAGTKHRGEFEERLQAVVREVSGSKNTILFIDEIHTLLGAGGEGASDAANILKPALARGDLHCIGITTTKEYRQYIEKDPALERRFQMVWVDEPTREEGIEILKGLQSKFEEHHDMEISEAAIEAAVELSMRYLPDFRLPDKAIDLIDQACASARITSLSMMDGVQLTTKIGREEIAAVVAKRCRLPIERLTENEARRLLNIEDVLRERIIGQDEAVRAVSESIRVARAGLKDPRKPIGVFLFVGTTGTGKTELAKALAEFLFDDERRLIRIDMSEYMEKHAVSRLIGAPPGYIGYDEEGQLTGQVRTHPFSVVLFDEIEKAHPDVLDICLQIFDDGRLTDSRGRRVSFTETVIIMTSNLGTNIKGVPKPIGLNLGNITTDSSSFDREAYQTQIMDAVRAALRPELVNRVQEIVFFYSLSETAVRKIIDKVLAGLRERLTESGVELELTDAAYSYLMQEGYDPRYGAREMERTIDHLIIRPLSKAILEGNFSAGATVQVDARAGKLVLEDIGRTRAFSSEN